MVMWLGDGWVSLSTAKVRLSERKAKQITKFLFSFPNESTFGAAKGTKISIKRARKELASFFEREKFMQ